MEFTVFLLVGLTFVLTRRSPTTELRPLEPNYLKIRCPWCQSQPRKQDRWYCDPGCHHQWNTFDTAGICPGCAKHWQETACLRCEQWSLHEAWYQTER
jgi:hypothetical protein